MCDLGYRKLLTKIRNTGESHKSRAGWTSRIFGHQVTFSTTPLLSLRRIGWRNALREMEWFLSGSDNINDLHKDVRHWWKPWVDCFGRVRNTYGPQLRKWGETGIGNGFDQIANVIQLLINDPTSRRNLTTTWHASQMVATETPIANCHGSVTQHFVDQFDQLHVVTYQRSCDVVVGVPHNWFQYWAYMLWLAVRTGRKPGSLTWIGGDVHTYANHTDLIEKMLTADVVGIETPELVYNGTPRSEFRAEDFTLDGEYHPVINKAATLNV